MLRLLDPHAVRPSLDQLGLGAAQRAALARLVAQPHGMVLVTGPTGSGKTTTLYALLGELDRERLNVMTVEDPVEYELPGVSQTQINLRAGMTFARGLRAILRQDPDVVLIGEIRDPETAQIAVQASLTGHLLLSTLHTNTALGAVTRLRDLGVADFLLAATLRGLVAQRLVRRLCPHCRRPQTLGPAEAQLAGLPAGSGAFRAAGCPQCSHTGYAGRCALVEVVELDETLCRLIHEGAGEAELERQVRDRLPSLRQEGFRLVAAGVTSIEEVLRATVD
ncbi:MAG: hypothetical protein KatS3mg124_1433 [Porticoccaceae bacterium]|nr:MAG: hypothetical protein KatS3mg124_1433 [Porticoccaceae bacterium]